jgi:phosphate transport system permease protein
MSSVAQAPTPTPSVGVERDGEAFRRATRRFVERGTMGAALGGAWLVIGLVVLLIVILAIGGAPAMSAFGLSFLFSTEWDPVQRQFGALPVLYGTAVSSLLALLFAVPLSIGTAVFLVRLAPRWLSGPCSFLVELLAAIPSIAYGFWGAAVLIPIMQHGLEPALKSTLGKLPLVGALFSGPAYGFGMLSAAIVLAIMVTPIITAVARDVLRQTPRELEEGAYALGATWWQTTLVVLQYSKTGLFGAVILGVARAVGETMAVTMVIGNRDQIAASLLAPSQTMASLLANEFLEADSKIYVSALIYVALVLLATTLAMNLIARLMIARASKPLRPPQAGPIAELAVAAPAEAEAARAAAAEATAAIRASYEAKLAAIGSSVPRAKRTIDLTMRSIAVGCALLCVACLVLITGYIAWRGVDGLSWDLFTKLPGPSGQPIGLRNCIVGTLILIGTASLVGVPAGIACGAYLAEYGRRSRLGAMVRTLVDVLAGVPSIVVGVVAYELIVVPMGHFSGLAGAVALGLLMTPIIARTSEEMLRLVPDSLREASLGAGATRAQTILRVVLPAASAGIVTGVMLAIARVAGETAPLLFTALGNDGDVYHLNQPFPALTLKIFQYATSPDDEWVRQAWGAMLVLIAIILVLNVLVRYVTKRTVGARR